MSEKEQEMSRRGLLAAGTVAAAAVALPSLVEGKQEGKKEENKTEIVDEKVKTGTLYDRLNTIQKIQFLLIERDKFPSRPNIYLGITEEDIPAENKIEEDIKYAAELVRKQFKDTKLKETKTSQIIKGVTSYKIPDKFYTDEYRLIDIQYLNKLGTVLYIFRDKDNNKVYHKENDVY